MTIYVNKMEIGSLSYEGQEVPWSAIYNLENKESWWFNLVQVQRTENQGSWHCTFWFKSEGPQTRALMSQDKPLSVSFSKENKNDAYGMMLIPVGPLHEWLWYITSQPSTGQSIIIEHLFCVEYCSYNTVSNDGNRLHGRHWKIVDIELLGNYTLEIHL